MLIRSGALDVVVIDSVAALVPRAEIEGEMGDSHVGLQARLMSQALRKMTGALNNSGTTMIFINQLREKIGVMFGCCSTAPGSRWRTARRRRSARSSTRSCRSRCCPTTASSDAVVPQGSSTGSTTARPSGSSTFTVAQAVTATGDAQFASHRRTTWSGHREAGARRGSSIAGDRVMQR